MSIFTILANLSTILGLAQTIESLVKLVIQTKKVPGVSSLMPLLDEVETLFTSGAIKIAGVNDQEVADAIALIKTELTKFEALLSPDVIPATPVASK